MLGAMTAVFCPIVGISVSQSVQHTPLDIATVPHMGGRPMDRGGLLAVDGAAERDVGGWITRAASAPEMTQG